jgi:hypothetical protein
MRNKLSPTPNHAHMSTDWSEKIRSVDSYSSASNRTGRRQCSWCFVLTRKIRSMFCAFSWERQVGFARSSSPGKWRSMLDLGFKVADRSVLWSTLTRRKHPPAMAGRSLRMCPIFTSPSVCAPSIHTSYVRIEGNYCRSPH